MEPSPGCAARGRHTEALAELAQTLPRFREEHGAESLSASNLLSTQAGVHRELGEPARALQDLQQAPAIHKALGVPQPVEYAELLMAAAERAADCGDAESSQAAADRALQALTERNLAHTDTAVELATLRERLRRRTGD